MTRNTLKNNTAINIPVSNGSQNKTCREVNVIADDKWFNQFDKTLESLYRKQPNYNTVIEKVYEPWKANIKAKTDILSISDFNFSSIQYICDYLDIIADFHSSVGITTKKKNEVLQYITKHFNCGTYINAIGGQKIYKKDDFASQGIQLNFIKMGDLDLVNPYASILDLLFTYDKDHLKEQIKKYTLI
jgi:hypothetical protein